MRNDKKTNRFTGLSYRQKRISESSFIMYVNDGSTDDTWKLILELHDNNKYVRGVNLAKMSDIKMRY